MINETRFLKKVLQQTIFNDYTTQAMLATGLAVNDAVRVLIGVYKQEINKAVSSLDFKKWKKYNYKMLVLEDVLFGAVFGAKEDETTKKLNKEIVQWFK